LRARPCCPGKTSEDGLPDDGVTESQIVAILKEGEAGIPVAEVCRKHDIIKDVLTKKF